MKYKLAVESMTAAYNFSLAENHRMLKNSDEETRENFKDSLQLVGLENNLQKSTGVASKQVGCLMLSLCYSVRSFIQKLSINKLNKN